MRIGNEGRESRVGMDLNSMELHFLRFSSCLSLSFSFPFLTCALECRFCRLRLTLCLSPFAPFSLHHLASEFIHFFPYPILLVVQRTFAVMFDSAISHVDSIACDTRRLRCTVPHLFSLPCTGSVHSMPLFILFPLLAFMSTDSRRERERERLMLSNCICFNGH